MARHKVYPLIVALSIAGSIAMGGCGSSTRVCNEAGCCGAGGDLCVAPRYLLADGHDGQVSIFPIDGTGALGTPTSVKGASMSLGMAAVNNQFVYVSDSQLGGMGLIDEWSVNLGTGALTPLQQSPFSLGTTSLTAGLAADNSRGILYVADAGKIDVLKVDATGTLSAVTGSPVPAGTNLYLTVDPQSRFVFASEDDLPGSVAAFTIDLASGALTPVPGSPFPAIPNAVSNSQPGEIVADATGMFVYTTLLATNQVAAFSIVAPGGALNPVPGSPFPVGGSPISLAAAGHFLYVSNVTDGTLSGFSIDPMTGVLKDLANSPFPIRAGALTTDLTGSFLYVSSSTGMMSFKVDPTSGVLTQVGSTVPYVGATVLTFVQ